MSQTIVVQEESLEEERNALLEVAQKAFRAGLGTIAYTQKEVADLFDNTQERLSDLFDRLVADGTKLEKDGRHAFTEMVESRRKQVDSTVNDARSNLESRVEQVLHSMNIPTRSDIEELNKKIAALTRKVNALSKEMKEEHVS